MPNFARALSPEKRSNLLAALLENPPQSFPLFQQKQEVLRGFTPADRPQGLDSDFDVLGQFLALQSGQNTGSGVDPTDNEVHLGDRFKTFIHPSAPNPFTGERSPILDLIDGISDEQKRRMMFMRRSNALRDALSGTPLVR